MVKIYIKCILLFKTGFYTMPDLQQYISIYVYSFSKCFDSKQLPMKAANKCNSITTLIIKGGKTNRLNLYINKIAYNQIQNWSSFKNDLECI